MAAPSFDAVTLAPGARIIARDEEWLVKRIDALPSRGYSVEVVGLSELVRNHERIFLTTLDELEELAPEATQLVADDSPRHRRARLFLESLLRRTQPTDVRIHLGHRGAFRRRHFQLEPTRLALDALRPRILIGDAVGLGKTLEVGVLLSELMKRGRGTRILVVALKSLLEQFQRELWSRFSIPLVRLDSVGIQRVRTRIPANRNPFTFFDKVIVSIDTLKDDGRYRHFLEQCHWDAAVIDECHNVANEGTARNLLAERLARTTDALILTSATPHNGRPESFANLMNMLSPTAIADPQNYGPDDIQGLFVRRFKKDVQDEVAEDFRERHLVPIALDASEPEEAFFSALSAARFRTLDGRTSADALYRSTVLKAFLSSPAACIETLEGRIGRIAKAIEEGSAPDGADADSAVLSDLRDVCGEVEPRFCSKLQKLFELLEELGYGGSARRARSAERVVLFSERIRTLTWLQEQLRERFGLTEEQVPVFHGGLPDIEQTELVDSFGRGDSQIRILIAGDVASEGVNLHFFCHWMVHFDVPWSLIKLEQRNGRIDRFGQTRPPEIRYLLNRSRDETTRGDLRIIEKLVEREEWIHKNLGEAGALMGHYNALREERDISRAIGRGIAPEEVIPTAPRSSLLDILTGAARTSREDPTAESPGLFDDYQFTRAALDELKDDLPGDMEIELEDGTQTIRFFAPEGFGPVLERLPPEAIPDRTRFELSARTDLVDEAIEAARSEGQGWPRVQLLWELHPFVQWLTDKVLASYERHEAPVIQAAGLQAHESIFLFQGQVSNKRAQPVVSRWFGIPWSGTQIDQAPYDLADVLERTGLAAAPPNPGSVDPSPLQDRVGPSCEKAREYVRTLRTERSDDLRGPLKEELSRLHAWADRSTERLDERIRERKAAGQLTRPLEESIARERREIDARMSEARAWVESTLQTEDRPYIRLVAVFTGAS